MTTVGLAEELRNNKPTTKRSENQFGTTTLIIQFRENRPGSHSPDVHKVYFPVNFRLA